MAHWRTMAKSENFCAADLWDQAGGAYRSGVVKIVEVREGEVVGQKGRKKGMPFLTLENKAGKRARAPFGANPTNCKSITAVLGTPDVTKWVGKWIELVVQKVDSPEGMVEAIRVSPRAPNVDAKQTTEPASSEPPLSDADKKAIEMEEASRG